MNIADMDIEDVKDFLAWAKSQGIKNADLTTGKFEFSEAFLLTEQAGKAIDNSANHNAPTSNTDASNKEPTDEEMLFWSAEPQRSPEEDA